MAPEIGNEKTRPAANPAGILGSRDLPESALRAVFGTAAAHAAEGGETWTGGARGADTAALAGAQAVGGKCKVYLAGCVDDVAKGEGDWPWSRPRELVRSCRAGEVIEYAGKVNANYRVRLVFRTRELLKDLRGIQGAEVWVFIAQKSYLEKKGGSVQTICEALKLGFVAGETLKVWIADDQGNLTEADREQPTETREM
jgi:hypothetical protein